MRAARLIAMAALACGAGCSGASSSPGLDALLRVPGAQYVPGAMPAAQDGPKLPTLADASSIIHAGELRGQLSGVASLDTTGIAVQMMGDPGYWVFPPGNEDPQLLGQLDFASAFQLSPLLPAGTFTLIGRAVNGRGQYGPPQLLDLTTDDVSATQTLLVSLRWDTEADLDLHLVTPDGTEIWANKINSYTPAPGASGGSAFTSGGILDFDSNANCVIDGRRLENIAWTAAPPSGHYIARVDSWSLCGQPEANWFVAVTLNGQSLGIASGTSRDSDAALPHGKGDGLTAIAFDVP